tara:strand:- start:380 stop:2284 length:1905 start_codon:yes stop_codon:yes gene_type:complete
MSKYERAQREAERKRRQEEWEAIQEQKENEAIDVEDLKQQEDMKQGNYLESRMFDIDPKKHKQAGKTEKIYKKATNPQAQGSEKEWVKKTGAQLPPILESREMDEIYAKDKEENKEFDEAVARGDLKEGVRIRQAGKLLRDSWEDTKAFKHWSNLPHNIGAVGARGVESFFTIDANNPKEVALELIQKVGNPRKGLAGEIIGEIPGVKVAIRQIKKEALNFAKHIMPNGYKAKYAMAGGGEIVEEAAEQTAKNNPLQMTGKGANRSDMATQRLNMQVRMAGSGMGFKNNIFNFDDYLKVRSQHSEADRRWFSGIFSTPVDYNTYRRGFATSASETAYLKRLKEDFMKTYPPEFLKQYKINPGDIQAHHIDALLASLPLYDGVEYLGKEWYDITGILLSKNVHAGNQAKNLKYLVGRRGWPKTPHGITHAYLDEIVGPDGQKLFTADVRAKMKKDPAFRKQMTEKWADITLQSNQIADQAAGVFNAINADLLNLQPKDIDQIMSSLGKLQNNGLVKPELIDGRWQIGAKEMRELLFDIDFTENIGQHFLLADPKGLRALRIALQSKDPISSYKAIKETLPKQLSLFNDNKVKILAKKSRRYSNKKWDIPDDVPPPRGEGEFPETGEGLDEFGNPL